MADFLPPAVAFLLGNIDDFVAKMDEADARMAETDGLMAKSGEMGKTAFLAVGAAVAGVAYEAVKMASEFDAAMTRINTQDNANLTVAQMTALKTSVLDLAGPTAQAPEALAEAMIHVYGSGLQGAQALDVLKTAAEGATVGNANLTDVTNALDAAIATGIKGTGDYQQAMGELNATVGAGDMTMQNLADALGGPMLATVKGYGLSLTDVGAGLAVFGDRNIRGAEAATQLRMAVQALAVPAAGPAAANALASIGLNVNTLKNDMLDGGLNQGLNDLNQHLLQAGYSSQTAGALITTAFGKKAGGGLNILLDSLSSSTSNFNDKFEQIAKTGTTFGADWAQTQDTLSFKMKSLGASTEALGIKVGEALTPKLLDFINLVQRDASPYVQEFGRDLHDAMDSPQLHEAEDVLASVFHDVGSFIRDTASAGADLLHVIEPTAEVLGGAFFVALDAVGAILSGVVGPMLKAVAGFLRDNTGVIEVLSDVALAGLATRLLYLKTIGLIDMFTSFVAGAGKATTAVLEFSRSITTGSVFDSLKGKVSGLGDAFTGLKKPVEESAAAEAQAALQTQLTAAAAAAGAGEQELLAAAAGSTANNFEIQTVASETLTARTQLLAAASGLTAAQVEGLGAASQAAAEAEDTAANSGQSFGNAIGGAIPIVGGLVTGAVMLGQWLGRVTDDSHVATVSVSQLTTQLLQASQATEGGTISFTTFDAATLKVQDSLGLGTKAMSNMDQMMAAMVQQGHADDAAHQFQAMSDAFVAAGGSADRFKQLVPGYEEALNQVAEKNALAASTTGDNTSALNANAGALGSVTGAADDTAAALQQVDDAYSEITANIATSKAFDDFQKDLLDVKTSIQQNGSELSSFTLKGLANQDAFRTAAQAILDYRDAQEKANVPVAQANQEAADQATQLLKVWEQAGANKTEVEDYAKSLGLIPSEMVTDLVIKQSGLDATLTKLQQINQNLKNMGASQITGTGVHYQAAGGPVVGPGGPTSDSVPTMLSNGEYVISAAGVNSVPRGLLDAINNGDTSAIGALVGGMSGASGGGLAPGGGFGGGGDVTVNVYVQDPNGGGWQQARNVRTEVLRYAQRNSGNNLTLVGSA